MGGGGFGDHMIFRENGGGHSSPMEYKGGGGGGALEHWLLTNCQWGGKHKNFTEP